jgi:hypothetical protein
LRKIPFFVSGLLLLPTALLADEVFLKGAGTISGRIVEQTDTMVTVDLGSGVMGVPMSHVDHIVKARSPLDDYDDRAGKLAPGDVNGWRELGKWAGQQGLETQSRSAYEKVLTVAPNDPEAREALGFVQLNGGWVTEEESYRARGYVKYENEWMMPAEAQMRQSKAAAEQAQQDAAQQARQAETDKMLADNRAATAAQRAADDQARANADAGYGAPVYWGGGWGYGATTWPSGSAGYVPGSFKPAQHGVPR